MPKIIRLGASLTELALIEPGRVRAGSESLSVEIDLRSGRVLPGGARMPKTPQPDLASTLGEVRERLHETDQGPVTELIDGTRAHRFEGAVQHGARAPGPGRLVGVVVGTPTDLGTRHELVTISLDGFSLAAGAPLRLPAHPATRIAVGDGLVAGSVPGALHLVRAGAAGDLGALTVPLPPSPRPAQLAIDGSTVVALAGNLLVIIDVLELTLDRNHRTTGLSFHEQTMRGHAHPEPAVVVFVMADKVLADHPSLRRLQLPRTPSSPTVQRGDRVRIDDVRQELAGLFRVHAWRREGDAPAAASAPEPLVLPAPTLPPTLDPGPRASVARTASRAALEALARAHGFEVPARMLAWLGLVDDDAVFRRWCAKLWLDPIEVRGLVRDWDADPSLVAFAGLGNGDEWCLYVHPDAAPGTIVLYAHESNTIDEEPRSFDAWMDAWLARFEAGHDEASRDLATRIRARLSLPASPPRSPASPPAWWRAAACVGEFADRAAADREAAAHVAAGRLREAERWALSRYLRGADSARAELSRIYEELGWTLQRAQLAERPA